MTNQITNGQKTKARTGNKSAYAIAADPASV